MVEVESATPLVGSNGAVPLVDAFEGRRLLIAYYFMWHQGKSAAEQCEGCTLYTSQFRELSFVHSRDATFAVICQGPYEESVRYRDFMGWELPWYGAERSSLDKLLAPGIPGLRDVLDNAARRRGDGKQLQLARPDRLWPAGGVGDVTCGLAAAS
jgi:hypothetical protein